MRSGWRRICCVERKRERGRTPEPALTTRAVTVVNALGLHARAAARFVQLAARFTSQVRVARDARVMDGKSIMGILLLAAPRGTTLTISADGADEQEASALIGAEREAGPVRGQPAGEAARDADRGGVGR